VQDNLVGGLVRFFFSLEFPSTVSDDGHEIAETIVLLALHGVKSICNGRCFLFLCWVRLTSTLDHTGGVCLEHLHKTAYGLYHTCILSDAVRSTMSFC
jgi:hypothetical protein